MFYAQDSLPSDPFYLLFTHDGEGGGIFEIVNVPTQITPEGGSPETVTSYSVAVEPGVPYYRSSFFTVDPANPSGREEPLTLSLKGQTLTLAPSVVGDQTPREFPMQVTFTNPCGVTTEQSSLVISKKPTNKNAAAISVPAGIHFVATQSPVNNYKLDPYYQVTAKIGGEEATVTQEGSAQGTITEGTDVTVTTKNTMI